MKSKPNCVGQTIEVVTQKLASGGRAVGRLDGRVVFVAGAAPEERVIAIVTADKDRFLEAEVVRVLEPSRFRVQPRCSHFGDCGGCSWQHISYSAQLEAKRQILEDSFRRIGKLTHWPELEIVAGEPWGTRNRAQLQPPVRVGDAWGFFAEGSRRTVSLQECPVLAPELQGIWTDLSEWDADPQAHRRERAAFVWGAQGKRAVRLPGHPAEVAEVELGGRILRFAADGFFQGNFALLPRFIELVVAGLSGERAVDLYAGVGLFAAQLESVFARVDAVESDPSAALFAPENLRSAVYHAQDVETWLSQNAERLAGTIDVAVVDPPRLGLSSDAALGLLALAPRTIRYVSCGHDTLARDLGVLVQGGYTIESVTLLDLYPQTPHMEVICTLQRIGQ